LRLLLPVFSLRLLPARGPRQLPAPGKGGDIVEAAETFVSLGTPLCGLLRRLRLPPVLAALFLCLCLEEASAVPLVGFLLQLFLPFLLL